MEKDFKIIESYDDFDIIDYNNNCIALVGEGTKEFKDDIKELFNGVYNRYLKCGKGWIIKKTQLENLINYLDK